MLKFKFKFIKRSDPIENGYNIYCNTKLLNGIWFIIKINKINSKKKVAPKKR